MQTPNERIEGIVNGWLVVGRWRLKIAAIEGYAISGDTTELIFNIHGHNFFVHQEDADVSAILAMLDRHFMGDCVKSPTDL